MQFWHDDPLQDLPDGLQLCPLTDGTEWVTKVYDPPSGAIEPLQLAGGQPIIPAGYAEQLRRALADIADKTNARLRFVGYTGNARLDRRTAAIYGDDVGLSAARARRAMEAVSQQMGLAPAQAEHEGRGFVHSNDVVNAGFVQGEISHVVVQAVYDELAPLDDYEGVDITRVTRELKTRSPFGVNLMHITVDGQPIDDPDRSSADVQRCTDLAMEKADIRFQFDNLVSRPRLSVSVTPAAAKFHRLERGLFLGQPVRFSMYANYWSFIERAEVRIFRAGESVMDEPLAVVDVDSSGLAEWLPVVPHLPGAGSSLQYVLRAYGRDGQFDDTRPQSLSMIHGGPDDHAAPDELLASAEAGQPADDAEGAVEDAELMADGELLGLVLESDVIADAPSEEEIAEREHLAPMPEGELLAGYGESSLAIQNIRLGSGTVKVQGSRIPAGHSVWVAGRRVPVDGAGNFVAEAILPSGMHTVEVAVRDEGGNETLYLRDLEFERRDGFFLGIADFTFAENRVSGPAEQLQGENPATDFDSPFDGRLAFYATQKFPEHWRLTASADTREGPVEDLFSNFLDKSPDALFRRIDPDYHYPSFGDDGAVEEIAPTLGKFYVKMSRNESHALWGNFRVGYLDNELAQVDRGLYGGNAHWEAETSTGFGEQRAALDAFVAEPGTIGGRDEFRGTGGSLYYLRNQDILAGSERVRVELRSRDSGLVTGVVNLRPVLDYDIDYLQGRIILAEPLSSSEDDSALVRDSGISGDEAYLVVRYEYAPGFDEIDTLNTGGQGHYWVNDHMRFGLTASRNEEGQGDSSLDGADLILRKSANSWLKLQAGRSEGLVSSSLYSDDGGFGFVAQDDLAFTGAGAEGYRADLSVGLGDLFTDANGRIALYGQSLGAGYSAPGLATLTDVRNYGGSFQLPVGERLLFSAKADKRVQELGLESNSQELNVRFEVSERWSVSTGVRKDLREDNSPIVPLTQELGERTDAVVQVGFDSLSSFSTYAFMQDTLEKTESREDNGRMGAGGSYAFGERMRMDMEVSDGDAGAGGRLGTNYQLSDRTNLYLNYALENERTDNGLRMRRGNLVSGMKRKLGDSSSVYLEERYQDTDLMSGLTHATGVTLVAKDRWNMGANMEVGTLTDFQTGAQTERKAGGLRLAYGRDKVQISNAVEYRSDETELGLTYTDRTTWLFRNNFKYQATPNWRLLGQLNHSFSDSSLGEFYDGAYTEAVLGYAYRPVTHDRFNLLTKYTYFYNLPTTDQVTLQDIAAQFIQKSHIASVDLTYDLTPSWSIGGKYARRLGELSLQREDPQFFDNTAQLYIVRTDLRVGQHWEGMLEGRVLELPDLDEQRRGALVAIYRYLGKNVKAGIGYNFTDFSEDLTDLSFTHEGVFINVIGSM